MNPRTAAFFLVVALLIPASALAQDSRGSGLGRESFFRGVSALSDRRYNVAVDAFEESYRVRAVPVVLYNLGLAYRGLGRNIAAIDAFERYLAQPAASATPEDIAAVRRAIAQLRESLVVVALAVTPTTAVVLVDGRPHALESGTLQLDPGAHMLECSAVGSISERREVRLEAGGRVALSFSLVSVEGRPLLVIEPSVATSVVHVDGERVGVGRVEIPSSAGEHHVEISAVGYASFERRVRVGASGVVRVDAVLAVRQRHVMLPIAIGVGVLVVGAIVVGVAASSRTEMPYVGGLGNVTEGLHAR